jgi:hypothetical protein
MIADCIFLGVPQARRGSWCSPPQQNRIFWLGMASEALFFIFHLLVPMDDQAIAVVH